MTPEQLATLTDAEREIWARAQAATPGPWYSREHEIYSGSYQGGIAILDDDPLAGIDVPFVTNARADIPALLVALADARLECKQP